MSKEERGELNIFVVNILASEKSHNNKQQSQNRHPHTYSIHSC